MTEQELLERIEAQSAELENMRAQLAQAIETAKRLAELEGQEKILYDENEALRRAIAEDEEIIRNMTEPIRKISERLDGITAAAGRVNVESLENVNARLDALTAAAGRADEKLRGIPRAAAANWIICALCIVATAAGLWYCSTQAKTAADAAARACWGIYTRPDAQGRSHSAIEWSADWQSWYETTQK